MYRYNHSFPMSTRIIALTFLLLLIIAGLFFFGGSAGAPAQVPSGTMMQTNTTPKNMQTQIFHTMPDGTVIQMEGMTQ